MSDYALRTARPGLIIIISDMFSPSGYNDGFAALMSKGYEVVVLHLLAPDEIDPPLAGDLRLIDVESHAAQEVTVDAGMRDIYIQRLKFWRDEIRADLLRRGGHYLFVETNGAWEKVVLQDLRRMGLLK